MSRLQKSLQDYFRLPILLKPLGKTAQSSVTQLQKILSQQQKPLHIENNSNNHLLANRPSCFQRLEFRTEEYHNNWSEFQVIYRCRFVVGVWDVQGNLLDQWKKAIKEAQDESRKLLGLIVLNISECDIGEVGSAIGIPKGVPISSYWDFLQPWFMGIVISIQEYLSTIIAQLQKDDNGFIVFNKAEEKPQPRTLKKKKKGRCLKICGDFCLCLQLVKKAYTFYVEAQELLKKVDDYLWLLGCCQGKLSCLTSDVQIEGINKQQAVQVARLQCINLSKKCKIPQIQIESMFKLLKLYTKITPIFLQMSQIFLNSVLTSSSTSQKFSILTQLAFLYRQAGMQRKCNYLLFLSARIATQLKTGLVGMILGEVLESKYIQQWPLLYANVVKLMIDASQGAIHSNSSVSNINSGEKRDLKNNREDANGLLHLKLLQKCFSVLTQKDVEVTVQMLQRRNFETIYLDKLEIFDIVSIQCIQSQIKPKPNNLLQQSPLKPSSNFFMNWRKKQTIYKFQQNQPCSFILKIRNNLNFPIRASFKLSFSPQSDCSCSFHSFFLQPNLNKLNLVQTFPNITKLLTLESIQCKIFNFCYREKPDADNNPANAMKMNLKMEIYEQYPQFIIQMPNVYRNQESSLFQFPVKIIRTKSYLKLEKVSLSVSVYYTIQVGFQEITFQLNPEQLSNNAKKYLIVLSDYPYQTSQQILKLPALKAHKNFLKKIQLKIDAIRSQSSKYQISKKQTSLCTFQRSIWCQLIRITTPYEKKFRTQTSSSRNSVRHENIIQDQFIVEIGVKKKIHDLTPYKIVSDAGMWILGEKTDAVVQKVIKKFVKNQQNSAKPLQIVFEWANSTRQKQCGTIIFQIPPDPKMFISQKQIKFSIQNWNKKQKQQLKGTSQLKISYKIVSKTNLSHNLVVQPRILPNIRKYILSGKSKIKDNRTNTSEDSERVIENSVKIKFLFQYFQEYLIGIKFQDGEIYWFPCLFAVVE